MARIQIDDLPPIETLSAEEQALIFGAGRFRPQLEVLEDRQMLSSTPAMPVPLAAANAQAASVASTPIGTTTSLETKADGRYIDIIAHTDAANGKHDIGFAFETDYYVWYQSEGDKRGQLGSRTTLIDTIFTGAYYERAKFHDPSGVYADSYSQELRITVLGQGKFVIDPATPPAVNPSAPGTISGQVFQANTHAGLAERTVFLDSNGNGILDKGETQVATGTTGSYTFKDLTPGTYKVREVLRAGEIQTTGNPADVVLASGANVGGVNFGVAAKPDVHMVSIALQKGQIGFTYEVTGKLPTDGLDIRLVQSTDGTFSQATTRLQTVHFPGSWLTAGTHTFWAPMGSGPGQIKLPVAGAGSYLVAKADPDNLIDEANETNNEAAIRLPDVHMVSIGIQNGQIGFTYEITGKLPADALDIRLV